MTTPELEIAPLPARRLAVAATALVVFTYFMWVFLMPADMFWSGDMGVKWMQTDALARSRWRRLSLDYPGRRIDPEGRYFPLSSLFAARVNGRWYAVFPPLFPFLSSFFYAAFGFVGLYLLPAAAGAATLAAALALAGRLGLGAHRAYLPVALGLGSPIFFYSVVFWEHTCAAALCTAALALWALNPRRPGHAAAAGALLGLACALRPECYCLVAACAAASLLAGRPADWRGAAALAAGALALCIPQWAFNAAVFGHPLGLHYLLNEHARFGGAAGWTERLRQAGANARRLLFNPGVEEPVHWPLLLPLAAFVAACWTRRAKLAAVVGAFAAFWLAALAALVASRFVMEGLFAVSPVCAFAFAAAPMLWREGDAARRRLMLASALFILAVLLTSPTAGGWQFGPRLLLPALPVLFLLGVKGAALLRERIPSRLIAVVFLTCIVVGLTAAFRAVWVADRIKSDWRLLSQAFERLPVQVIVTDQPYPPQHLAVLGRRKPFFLLRGEEPDATDLVNRLAAAGVTRFLFVSNQPRLPVHVNRLRGCRGLRPGEKGTFRVNQLAFRAYEILK